jgi:O-antigen/teichoic acid export membrane protein
MVSSSISRISNALGERLDHETTILIRNSSWVFIANLVTTGVTFFRSVILGRTLGVELYGIFLIVIAFVVTVQEFFNLNIGTALIKFGADYKANNQEAKFVALLKASYWLAGTAAILSLIFIIIVSHFGYRIFIKKPGLVPYLIAYAFGGCFGFFQDISTSLLRLYYRFKLNSLITIGSSILEILLLILVVYHFPHQLPYVMVVVVFSMVFQGVLINGVALWEIRRDLRPYLQTRLSMIRTDARRVASFIVNNSASRTLKTLTSNGDVLILGAISGGIQVGLYGVAKRLAFSLLRITDPITNAIYPQVATLISNRRYYEIKRMLKRVTLFLSIPLGIFFMILLFFNEKIIVLIYGGSYRNAGKPFLFLFATSTLGAVFFWTLSVIFGLGKVNLRLLVYAIALIIGAVIALLLAPSLGATGIAIALLTTEIIIQITFILVIKSGLSPKRDFE